MEVQRGMQCVPSFFGTWRMVSMWPTNGRGCIAKLHSIATMLVASPEQDQIHGATHFLSFLFPLVVFAFSFPLLALQYVSLPFPFQILLTYHSIRKVHDTGQVDGATSV